MQSNGDIETYRLVGMKSRSNIAPVPHTSKACVLEAVRQVIGGGQHAPRRQGTYHCGYLGSWDGSLHGSREQQRPVPCRPIFQKRHVSQATRNALGEHHAPARDHGLRALFSGNGELHDARGHEGAQHALPFEPNHREIGEIVNSCSARTACVTLTKP